MWQASLSRPGMRGPAGALPVALRAAAVPGAGREAEHLARDARLVERAREHVDQHGDRFDVLLHRARAVDQEGHDAIGHRLDRARCGTARRSVGDATSCASRRPSMRPSSCAPSQPSRARQRQQRPCSSRASRAMLTPCAAMRRSSRSRYRVSSAARTSARRLEFAVVGGREDAVAVGGFVEQRGRGRWRPSRGARRRRSCSMSGPAPSGRARVRFVVRAAATRLSSPARASPRRSRARWPAHGTHRRPGRRAPAQAGQRRGRAAGPAPRGCLDQASVASTTGCARHAGAADLGDGVEQQAAARSRSAPPWWKASDHRHGGATGCGHAGHRAGTSASSTSPRTRCSLAARRKWRSAKTSTYGMGLSADTTWGTSPSSITAAI